MHIQEAAGSKVEKEYWTMRVKGKSQRLKMLKINNYIATRPQWNDDNSNCITLYTFCIKKEQFFVFRKQTLNSKRTSKHEICKAYFDSL